MKFCFEVLMIGFRISDSFHSIKIFDFRLCERRLAFFVTELFDQFFKAFDIFLLSFKGGLLFFLIQGFLLRIGSVITAIARQIAELKFPDDFSNMVDEHAIMRNENNRFFIILKIGFEPFDRGHIQMVSRFI